jgi:hypothetical protein
LLSGQRNHQIGTPPKTLVPYEAMPPPGLSFMVAFKIPVKPALLLFDHRQH